MFSKYPVSEVAALLSDPARVAMLTALLGGESRPAGELARIARLSPQAASAHLAKLTAAQMLVMVRLGRHHYYRIAKPEVGLALEALAAVSPAMNRTGIPETDEARALRSARTCFDHLAGRAAVSIADSLVRKGFLIRGATDFQLTTSGENFLQSLDLDTSLLRARRRTFAKACLDWTERKHHIAGALGAGLLNAFCDKKWVNTQRGTRAVRITSSGRRELGRLLDVRFE